MVEPCGYSKLRSLFVQKSYIFLYNLYTSLDNPLEAGPNLKKPSQIFATLQPLRVLQAAARITCDCGYLDSCRAGVALPQGGEKYDTGVVLEQTQKLQRQQEVISSLQ